MKHCLWIYKLAFGFLRNSNKNMIMRQMQRELLRVQRIQGVSILFVTHSIDEALLLGHKIVVIEKGVVKAEFQLAKTENFRNLLDEEFITLKREIIKNLNVMI